MQRLGVEDSSDLSIANERSEGLPETVDTTNDEPRHEREELTGRAEPMDEPVGALPETVESTADERREVRAEPPIAPPRPVSAREDELLAQVHRLEVELERYREHAQRTSKLFLSTTKYVEWVRENARRDSELALRKARARVEKLDASARELERTELELVQAREELARLQALTDETRARLSAFLEAGLQVLNRDATASPETGSGELGDLEDTLQGRVAATSVSAIQAADVVTPKH